MTDNADVTLKLNYLFRPEESNLAAGNTHLHLRSFTRDGSRRLSCGRSGRRRAEACCSSPTSNATRTTMLHHQPVSDRRSHGRATGVLFNNGEEHRHNFEPQGQGYGHVMFLNIKDLVKPVSLGPGITAAALTIGHWARHRRGPQTGRHGHLVPQHVRLRRRLSALAGHLDALNVFDGSRTRQL